jgi:hypothetical protein
MMQLEPLRQWICDTCGELIARPEDGWVEWQNEKQKTSEPEPRYYDFRIVHQIVASPRREERTEGCYAPNHQMMSSHLHHLLGPDGLIGWIEHIERGTVKDLDGWAEMMRRLYIPYYEEARLYLADARDDGYVDSGNEKRLCQETLQGLVKHYRDKERT